MDVLRRCGSCTSFIIITFIKSLLFVCLICIAGIVSCFYILFSCIPHLAKLIMLIFRCKEDGYYYDLNLDYKTVDKIKKRYIVGKGLV